MPHLSEIKERTAFSREVAVTSFKLAAITAVIATLIYLCRDWIIAIVFTPEFNPVKTLMPYQLFGDVLKMAGFPIRMGLSIQMRSVWYICVEVGITVVWVGLTYFWMPEHGAAAATLAYACAWGGGMMVAALGIRRK